MQTSGLQNQGSGDADHNGWRFYDELYDQTPHTPTEQAKIIAYIPTWRKDEDLTMPMMRCINTSPME
jgi:CDP-glycerol glycerophosphotransferase (TagB/SpsB family)